MTDEDYFEEIRNINEELQDIADKTAKQGNNRGNDEKT